MGQPEVWQYLKANPLSTMKEVSKVTKMPYNSVVRSITKLEEVGILTHEKVYENTHHMKRFKVV